MKANDFLQQALTAMQDRAKLRDTTSDAGKEEERSMAATVKAFNEVRGKDLSEEDGWAFMVLLKLARSTNGQFHSDDYVDGAAYFGLLGEAAEKERGCKKAAPEKSTTDTFFGQQLESTHHWRFFQEALEYNTKSTSEGYLTTANVYNHYLNWVFTNFPKMNKLSEAHLEEILKRKLYPNVLHSTNPFNKKHLWNVTLKPIAGLGNVSNWGPGE